MGSADFKVQVVLESYQRDTTLEEVCQRFEVPLAHVHRWRQEFQEKAPQLFLAGGAPAAQTGKRAKENFAAPTDKQPGEQEEPTSNHVLWGWFSKFLHGISWR